MASAELADLLAATAAVPAAQAMVDVLTKTNWFALIYRVNAVKRAQTRERKIGEDPSGDRYSVVRRGARFYGGSTKQMFTDERERDRMSRDLGRDSRNG